MILVPYQVPVPALTYLLMIRDAVLLDTQFQI